MDIGTRLEVFVDDSLIERMSGVELRLQHPVPRENVFTFDAPWEGSTSAYVTIFQDGDKYRMYYRGSGGESKDWKGVTCTAESSDGVHWTRPKLRLFEYVGTNDSNIVWTGPASNEGFAPFKDKNPDAKPDALYKAVSPVPMPDKHPALHTFTSPDGYRWTQSSEPIITKGAFDSQNLAFWDTQRKEYVCYFRDYRNRTRDIKRSTSKDFIHWTEAEWLDWGDAPSDQLYTNAITQYYRAPHIYVGFPKRLVLGRKTVAEHRFDGVSDGVFMSSRDGLAFHRWGEGFMRAGLDQENWTDRNVMAAWGLLELNPGEVSIYYSQHYRHSTNRLIRATVRTDGFVAMHAGYQDGEFVTKPLTFTGRELVLNYSTSAVGGIQVEVQDAEGKPVTNFRMEDCPVIYGDQIERVVAWNSGSDLSSLAGKPVRLRFRMSDADLFSMRFR